MQEAIMMVKAELGREAIILHSKKIKKGVFGLFGKPAVEVIAAINPEDRAPVQKARHEAAPIKEILELTTIHQEIAQVKEALVSLNTNFTSKLHEEFLPPAHLKQICTLLSSQGVADTYIKELVLALESSTEAGGELAAAAQAFLSSTLQSEAFKGGRGGQRVAAFVGPTGVGKTTTIAKLAAQLALFDGLSVGLITADTYRIAAVDQLKTYAEIIGVPLEVVFSVADMAKARAKYADKDCILIDTAGRSQKNVGQMSELQNFLEAAVPSDVALVLSANMQAEVIQDCLDRFEPCAYNQLIFTKLDETNGYGPMYNAIRGSGLPLSYVTIGQNVPEDIRVGEPEYISGLLLGGQESNQDDPEYRS